MNYQLVLDETIKNLTNVPKLLLHVCCAPCSSHVLELLNEQYDITAYFYNPNITDPNEYNLRFAP